MVYVIIGIVAVLVLGIILHFINKSFYLKHGYSLFGGSVTMLAVIACLVLAFLLKINTFISVILGGVGIILLIILMVVNTKRLGFGTALVALLLQTIFCVPSLLLIVEFFTQKGYSPTGNTMRHKRRKLDKERQRRLRDRDYY